MADVSDEIIHLEQLAVTHRRRLRVLATQHARFAERDVPPHLVLELEDTRRDLLRIEADLRRLRPGPADARPPYLGLATFQEANADLFFGRDTLVADLVERAGRASFLAVLGASGSGKSSVVRAGLIPMLKGCALPGSDTWRYVIFKPGARPLDTLAAELAKLQGGDLGAALALSRQLAETDRALLLAADMLLDGTASQRLVLVVDQFEELWTLLPADAEQRAALLAQQHDPFTQLLLTAAAAPHTPLLVVLAMRADFLHRAAKHPVLASAIAEHDVIVSPMTPNELRDAIVRPAELAGGSFEAGLVEDLIAQTSGREGALPLLEYILLELWKQRQPDGTMTWNAYQTLGGVEGALAARADAILEAHYTPEQQDALRQVLLRLIQPGEGATDTRRRVRLADLVAAGESLDTIQELLQPLIDERLLTASGDNATGDETIEVTHETLIRTWPTLQRWLDEARVDMRLHLQLEEAAKEWQISDHHSTLLWSGLRLANTKAWIERAHPRLNVREQAFLRASGAEERRSRKERIIALIDRASLTKERRAARRLRTYLFIISLLLLITGLVSIAAVQGRQEATRANARAHAIAWAGEALFELQHQPERALALTLAAHAADPIGIEPMVARAIFSSFEDGRIRRVIKLRSGVTAVSWSSDGKFILTVDRDGTAQIWGATTGAEVRTLPQRMDHVGTAAWSPDNKFILVGDGNGIVRILEAVSGKEIRALHGDARAVTEVAWSPDGKFVLAGGGSGVVRVWNPATGSLIHILDRHREYVSAVWSPDSRFILTGAVDGARIWDAATGSEIGDLSANSDGGISDMAWSPDGKLVLTGGALGVQVLDPFRGREVRTLHVNYTDTISSVAWSPDGEFILIGGNTGGNYVARVFNAYSGREVRTLRGHTDIIWDVAWSPNGAFMLTTDNMTIKIWDAVSSVEMYDLSSGYPGRGAAWSPDGKYIAGSGDNGAKVWDAARGSEIRTLRGHTGNILDVTWSPDSKLIATASDDKTVRIWDAGSGSEVRTLHGYSGYVSEVAWSPDGKFIVTGGAHGAAEVRNIASGAVVRTLLGHTDVVSGVAWSPDGKFILTGSFDATARIWDAASGAEVRTVRDETGVTAVGWSPDSKFILTGGYTGVRIWDAASGSKVRTLGGQWDPVRAVSWSPDSSFILTGGDNGTVRVWDAGSGIEVRILYSDNSRIVAAEWSPDGKFVLMSDSLTIRVLLADIRLMTADLTRRVCDIYERDDAKIRAEAPGWNWPGCAAALAAVDTDLKELNALRSDQ